MQLVGVLRLGEEQLPEAERLHCLKLFTNLLSTQVGQQVTQVSSSAVSRNSNPA
jgi:hypothetical protein